MRSREPERLKVVLDTSVAVAALLSKSGASAKVLEAILAGRVSNFYTDEIAAELDEVLRRKKFDLEREKREHFVHLLAESSFLVQPLPEFEVALCRDREDDKFLSLAAQAEADYLVSLDDDLLDLRRIGPTLIIKPAALIALLAKVGRR